MSHHSVISGVVLYYYEVRPLLHHKFFPKRFGNAHKLGYRAMFVLLQLHKGLTWCNPFLTRLKAIAPSEHPNHEIMGQKHESGIVTMLQKTTSSFRYAFWKEYHSFQYWIINYTKSKISTVVSAIIFFASSWCHNIAAGRGTDPVGVVCYSRYQCVHFFLFFLLYMCIYPSKIKHKSCFNSSLLFIAMAFCATFAINYLSD